MGLRLSRQVFIADDGLFPAHYQFEVKISAQEQGFTGKVVFIFSTHLLTGILHFLDTEKNVVGIVDAVIIVHPVLFDAGVLIIIAVTGHGCPFRIVVNVLSHSHFVTPESFENILYLCNGICVGTAIQLSVNGR